jgi:hypothetical protein
VSPGCALQLLSSVIKRLKECSLLLRRPFTSKPTLFVRGKRLCQTDLPRSHRRLRRGPRKILIVLNGRSRRWLIFFSGYPLALRIPP